MLSHLRMEDNLCLIKATVKCQEVLVDMDAVSRLRVQDGTRVMARVTASAMATAIKAKHSILLVIFNGDRGTADGRPCANSKSATDDL